VGQMMQSSGQHHQYCHIQRCPTHGENGDDRQARQNQSGRHRAHCIARSTERTGRTGVRQHLTGKEIVHANFFGWNRCSCFSCYALVTYKYEGSSGRRTSHSCSKTWVDGAGGSYLTKIARSNEFMVSACVMKLVFHTPVNLQISHIYNTAYMPYTATSQFSFAAND